MRNTEMATLGPIVGEWSMTMSDAVVPRTDRHHGARYHHHRVVRGVVTGRAVCLRRGPARAFRDEPRPRTQRPERPICRPLPRRSRCLPPLRHDLRWRALDHDPRGSGLPPAFHRRRREGPHLRQLAGFRGRGQDLAEGLRPHLRARLSLWAERDCLVRLADGVFVDSQDVVMTKSPDRMAVEALVTAGKPARYAISATCANPGTSLRH